MATSAKQKRLLDAYRFIGFRPLEQLHGVFGDPKARVVTLVRRSKKRPAACADDCTRAGTIAADGEWGGSARSVLRGVWDLPRVRGSAGVLPTLCGGEARAAFVSGRRGTAYEAV